MLTDEVAEPVASAPVDVVTPETLAAVAPEVRTQNVYQNVPNVAMDGPQLNCRSDDDVYEEYAFDKSEKGSDTFQTVGGEASSCDANQLGSQNTAPLDPNVVYQQVKYLRRSIHEVNALLEDSTGTNCPEGQVAPKDETNSDVLVPDNGSYALVECTPSKLENAGACPETHFDYALTETEQESFPNDQYSPPSVSAPFSINNEVENGNGETGSVLGGCDSGEGFLHPTPAEAPVFAASCSSMSLSSQEPLPASVFPSHCATDDISSQDPEQACEFPTHCGETTHSADPFLTTSTCTLSDTSPMSEVRVLKAATDSQRRFESEIGRELVRERLMTQELEEVRTTRISPQDSPVHKTDRGSKSNVKELLSRFESTPMDSEIPNLSPTSPSPLPSRRSDPHPKSAEKVDITSATLPPCLRARAARIARTKLTSSNNFSASLDEDHFLRSGGSKGEGRALIRTQTEPDVNKGNRSNEEHEQHDASTESKAAENACAMFSQDDDPQRRERIERYKEERRSFLRKKYRSESFRNEEDDTLARLKQKAGAKSGHAAADTPEDISPDQHRGGKQIKNNLPGNTLPVKDCSSPPKSPSKSKSGKSIQSPSSSEPITCVTVRQRIVTPDKVSIKGCESPLSPKSPRNDKNKFGFSPEKVSAGKMSPEHKFSERTRIPVSVDLAHVERRPAQLVLVQRSSLPVVSSERRMSAGNKVSSDSNYPIGEVKRRASVESNSSQRSPIKSPSYCIRDMAKLFEAKENSSRNATSNTPSKPTASTTGKNFVSSV